MWLDEVFPLAFCEGHLAHELGLYLVLRSIFCPPHFWTLKGCPLPHATSFFSAKPPERLSLLAVSTAQWLSEVQICYFLAFVLLDLSVGQGHWPLLKFPFC